MFVKSLTQILRMPERYPVFRFEQHQTAVFREPELRSEGNEFSGIFKVRHVAGILAVDLFVRVAAVREPCRPVFRGI